MAKRKRKRGQLSQYFRQVFKDNPQWLKEKSNDETLAKYRSDHNLAEDAVLDKSVKGTLANLKSVLRHQGRGKGKRAAAAIAEVTVARGGQHLEVLEEMIDDCLLFAKNMDRQGLEHIIRLLHQARNEVVWKIGE